MFTFGVGSIVVIALTGIALVVFVRSSVMTFGSVDRRRVERFALREALRVTPGNGNAVIRYLATTRRWRAGLLVSVLAASTVADFLVRGGIDVQLLPAFCGWFIGAVIAESRVDSLARAARGVAVLRRRQVSDYVRRTVLVIGGLLWLTVPVLGVVAVAVTLRRSSSWAAPLLALAATVVAGAAVALVSRRILQRPQPLVAPELIEADNAIRARSLNVLAGSALAIGGYLGAVFVGEIAGSSRSPTLQVAHLLGFVALPIAGVVVARAPRAIPVTVSSRALTA